jgi:hypothetical protein
MEGRKFAYCDEFLQAALRIKLLEAFQRHNKKNLHPNAFF